MTDSLELLNLRITRLLEKYTVAQAENKRLRETVHAQLQSIEQLNQQLARLEARMQSMQPGNAKTEAGENAALRQEVERAISEIDNMLKSLNELPGE